MKKLRLSALLLTTLVCSGCSFYETEGDASIAPQSSVASEIESKQEQSSLSSAPVSKPSLPQASCEGQPKIVDTFSTKGLDGNTYTQAMFSGKLTLLNMWGTYCGPCITEMPYLAKWHKEFADADFQVVGVLIDITDSNGNVVASQKTKANNIVAQAGVTYTNLLPCAGLNNFMNSTQYVPFSVFIDEHGHQLGESITGGMSSTAWKNAIINAINQYM